MRCKKERCYSLANRPCSLAIDHLRFPCRTGDIRGVEIKILLRVKGLYSKAEGSTASGKRRELGRFVCLGVQTGEGVRCVVVEATAPTFFVTGERENTQAVCVWMCLYDVVGVCHLNRCFRALVDKLRQACSRRVSHLLHCADPDNW